MKKSGKKSWKKVEKKVKKKSEKKWKNITYSEPLLSDGIEFCVQFIGKIRNVVQNYSDECIWENL